MKKLMLGAFIALFTLNANAYDALIQSDCVHLSDVLGGSYPQVQVQCGFMPGDDKLVPSSLVASTLKRSALPVPEMQTSFHVKRAGEKLSEEAVRAKLELAYNNKYPDKEVRIENLRFGREIYIAPNVDWDITADTSKFGAGFGNIVSGGTKLNFSYVAKVYEMGYILTDRLRAGDSIADAITPELIDVTNLRESLVKDPDNLIAAKALVRGKALTTDMVQTAPDRVKGDPILLIYNDGPIKLEITGIAEGNAVVGKTFPVRNPTSNKIFSAVYQGNGRAVVN